MSPGIRSRLLSTQSDERLVALVHAGHEPAFEALVHRYRRPLLRYCRRLCPSEARAEEVLQQALMNAWVALRGDCEVRDVRAWLYRVAHNAAVNAIRSERAMAAGPISVEDLHGGERATAITAAGAPSLDQVLALHDALTGMAELPQMQREVMVRTAVGGHSHAEVASALGITATAVRGLLYRARAALRDGITAVTPAPLLAWAAGNGDAPTSASERVAVLVAGGSAPFAGLAVKSAAVAITAGVAITGSVIARDGAAHKAHRHSWAAGTGSGLASTALARARDRSADLSVVAATGASATATNPKGGSDRHARRTALKPLATSSPVVNVRSAAGDGFQPVSITLPGSQAGEARLHGEPAAEDTKSHHDPAGVQGTSGGAGAAGAPAWGDGGEGQSNGRSHGHGKGQGTHGEGSHGQESQQGGVQESQQGSGNGNDRQSGAHGGQGSGKAQESRREEQGAEQGSGQSFQQDVGQEAPQHKGGAPSGEHGGEEPRGGGEGHREGD